MTQEDQRFFIKINVLLESPPSVVTCQLANPVPETCLTDRTVRQWCHDFKVGKQADVSDLPSTGGSVSEDGVKAITREPLNR